MRLTWIPTRTSRRAKSVTSTGSMIRRCSWSPPIGSAPTTSCWTPRSPTRAVFSPRPVSSGSSTSRCPTTWPEDLPTKGSQLGARALDGGPRPADGGRGCVARGYLTGSGLLDYNATGAVCGIALPAAQGGQQAAEPIFTPASKAELGDHDENITYEQVVSLVGADRRRPAGGDTRRLRSGCRLGG